MNGGVTRQKAQNSSATNFISVLGGPSHLIVTNLVSALFVDGFLKTPRIGDPLPNRGETAAKMVHPGLPPWGNPPCLCTARIAFPHITEPGEWDVTCPPAGIWPRDFSPKDHGQNQLACWCWSLKIGLEKIQNMYRTCTDPRRYVWAHRCRHVQLWTDSSRNPL